MSSENPEASPPSSSSPSDREPSARILAFAGSARRDSFNKKLLAVVAEGARAAGAEVEIVDLADFPMPIFDQDLEAEEGLPTNARRLEQMLRERDGLLIASPEYNSSISPLLKNTLDWISRSKEGGGPPLAAFKNKVAALVAASPGRLGGLRGLVHVRAILQNMGVMVIPDQLAVSQAHRAFTADGKLEDSRQRGRAEDIGRRLTEILGRLKK